MNWLSHTHYVCFSGGGVRGIAYLGVWTVLKQSFQQIGVDIYQHMKGYAGASAGALFALMLTLGYCEQDLWNYVLDPEFSNVFIDMCLPNLWHSWGLSNKRIQNQRIREALARVADGNPDVTFYELYQLTGKELVVSVTCVNTASVEYHSFRTVPDVPVWLSVSASMSVPIMFAPTRIHQYLYVDGGLLDNLPLPFDMGDTIAFELQGKESDQLDTFTTFVSRLMMVQTIANGRRKRQEMCTGHRNNRHRLVRVFTGNISSFEYHLTDAKKKMLVLYGCLAVYANLFPHLFITFLIRRWLEWYNRMQASTTSASTSSTTDETTL
jgi:predicted acylesterase/phospholipase RssA